MSLHVQLEESFDCMRSQSVCLSKATTKKGKSSWDLWNMFVITSRQRQRQDDQHQRGLAWEFNAS